MNYYRVFIVSLFVLFILTLLTNCVSLGPSDWRPDQHVMMARSCRIACHPGVLKKYDAMDGSCECQSRGK